MDNSANPQREILSVTDLNRRARSLLEAQFKQIWVEGEISNFSRPASGHWYFTLKDNGAQVRCAMFANRNRGLRLQVQNGMHVIVRAKVSLYEGRGDYQLIAESLIDAGEGLLQRQFEELKRKLTEQGLFSEQRKQALPALPSHIGVITSPTGAAIKDILAVLARRFPSIPVSILPVAVQGKEAASQIVAAIELAQRQQDSEQPIDALIVGRGGGSLEDLWPFNEECVARAIFACPIPIVAAVGHEVDFTIADFVADVRAATPSAAAELLSPDREEWLLSLKKHQHTLSSSLQRQLLNANQQLSNLSKRLRHPGQQLQEQAQRLDELEARFTLAIRQQLTLQHSQLKTLSATLNQHKPHHQIDRLSVQNQQLAQQLQRAMHHRLDSYQQRLKANSLALHTLSPLQTLSRGYAITKDQQGHIIRSSDDVQVGDQVSTQLGYGQLNCTVDAVNND